MTAFTPASCSACGTPTPADARFCSGCGRALAGGPPRAAAKPVTGDRLPWLVAGGALAAMLAMLLVLTARGEPPEPGAPGVEVATSGERGTLAPDISRLSPKERFDRLYDRVMQAAQSGDQATMSRLMPMALGGYEMLDSADADARYHAALLRIHNGDVEGSRALGDSILASQPGHLLGYVVLGTAARWARDDAALSKAYREFLAHYDREIKAARGEYEEHRASLEEFRRRARAGP